jgi:hypothetical protein
MRMYGMTRATTTLLAAAVAGLLIWLATQVGDESVGGFWATYGLIAAAGLVMALSQLLGGWTKWGMPRLSVPFLLLAFVPIAVAALWVVVTAEPGNGWVHRHVLSWSSDIHIRGLVNDLKEYVPVFAFGIGLVFGYSFDTTGPRRDVAVDRRRGFFRRRPVAAPATTDERAAADEPVSAERTTVDEPAASRDGELVGARSGTPDVAGRGATVEGQRTTRRVDE